MIVYVLWQLRQQFKERYLFSSTTSLKLSTKGINGLEGEFQTLQIPLWRFHSLDMKVLRATMKGVSGVWNCCRQSQQGLRHLRSCSLRLALHHPSTIYKHSVFWRYCLYFVVNNPILTWGLLILKGFIFQFDWTIRTSVDKIHLSIHWTKLTLSRSHAWQNVVVCLNVLVLNFQQRRSS